ncbi:MAG: diguanylate cyclase domain-containing protein [Bacillota bacterium]
MAKISRRQVADNAVVAVAFFLTAWAGQTLCFPPFVASVVCPASGVALAMTIIRGRHVWPGVLAGTFAILAKVLVIDGGAPLAAGLACALFVGVAQAVQAYAGGLFFRWWVNDPCFESPAAAFRYVFVAITSAILGSSGAVLALILFGFIQADVLSEITVWAVGRTAGMLIFTPTIVLFAQRRNRALPNERRMEALLLLTVMAAISVTVFSVPGELANRYPVEYIVFPGLLWALERFSNRESALLVTIVSVIATYGTAHQLGPFAVSADPNISLMLMELYFAVMTISSLVGGAVVAQRNCAQRMVENARQVLEERVAQRTHELRQVNETLEAEINERRLLAKAFEHSVEPTLITDADLRILTVNAAFTSVTGYALAEVRGHCLDLLVAHCTDQGRYEQLMAQLDGKDEAKGEIRCRRHQDKDIAVFPSWVSIAVVRDTGGRITQHIVSLADITEQKALEEHRAYRANHDLLTGLLNRASLEDVLHRTIAYARRSRLRFGMLFVDLDYFKTINDEYGHIIGDKLLKLIAERLLSQVRNEDSVARLGGDEFVIVLPHVQEASDVERVAFAVVDQLAKPFHIDSYELNISSSIGACFFPDDAQTAEELLTRADTAMYQAKTSRNTYRFYSTDPCACTLSLDEAQNNPEELTLARDSRRLVEAA